MEAEFWHKRWTDNVIGFHLNEANPLLVAHVNALALKAGSRVFIPLCGKTLDIAWLLSKGYAVAGVELSALAVGQLFEQLAITPTKTELGELTLYSADNIDIFVGDIFQLSKEILGAVDAIYDRASFVALPLAMRHRYTQHLIEITSSASQLLISFEYDQTLVDGPPFSISNQEINQHYQRAYDITLLANEEVEGGLKGEFDAVENVWLLKKAFKNQMFDEPEIKPPQRGKWKLMLPVILLLVVGGWLVYRYDFDATVAAGGAVLVGFYTGLVSWLLGVIVLVPVIGPILVKILTMSFIWLLNAVGYFVAYVAIKRGYSKDVLTYRGLTIALIVGMIIGYVLGSL
ncbi:MAG: thiopurine S-methyltransferase [Methylophilaceae bacterium]